MNPLHRIIDANANRAREALRVLEDLARFGLDDAPLSESLKSLRHNLIAALASLGIPPADLLSSRDTEADVGTAISTPTEHHRPDLVSLARANAARLTEALRSLEEAAKALNLDARPFESLRYRAYTLEQSIVSALALPALPAVRLCVLLTESLCTLPWLEVAARSIAGGCNILQLREKSLPDRELLARARALVALVREHRATPDAPRPLAFINDRPDIARLSGADGLHIGPDDLAPADARRIIGPAIHLGISTDSIPRAKDAIAAGASICGVGPMFPTTTKPKPVTLGPEYLTQYIADPETSRVPHLAIGGITPDTLPTLVARGCSGIAVSSVVCRENDPEAVCRQLLATLKPNTPASHLSGERPHLESR